MEKIHKQFVFLAVVLGGANLLFAGNHNREDYFCEGYNIPTVGEASLHPPLLSSYSPTEFGLGGAFKATRKPQPVVHVVPDNDDIDELKEVCFSDAPVITPSQEMTAGLNRFVLLGAATEGFRVAETPSPVKRTRTLKRLLDDLAGEATRNPEQLKTLLEADSEQMVHLRKLLAGSADGGAAAAPLEVAQRRKLNSPRNKRRSFHGATTADFNSIVVQSPQLRRSESLGHEEAAKA